MAVLVLAASFNLISNTAPPQTLTETPTYTYTVVNIFTHDSNAFTEGLAYANGFLYESTGLNSESSLRKVNSPQAKFCNKATFLPSILAKA